MSWRDEMQPVIGAAMDEADRLGLTGLDRQRFVRRSKPAWVRTCSWQTKVWQSEMRRLFGRMRERPADPEQGRLF